MLRSAQLLVGIFCVGAMLIGPASAQMQVPTETPIKPQRVIIDKAGANQRIEQREASKKWSKCAKLRKEQKIAWRQRSKFMNDCTAK